MEKFDFNKDDKLEIFNDFVMRAKSVGQTLISDVKETIKRYEKAIDTNSKDIKENDNAINKCDQEISRKKEEIGRLKDKIENVQNTYKKMVDAYSSTSRGDTKDIYSNIMNNAKVSCDEEVNKYNEEISKLSEDIEQIKNNIIEFSNTANNLNMLLNKNSQELDKFKKVLDYLTDNINKYSNSIDNINNNITQSRNRGISYNFGYYRPDYNNNYNTKVEPKEEPKKEESAISFDDSLKQIYDLTGYKPKEEEEPKVIEPEETNTNIFDSNLEAFLNATKDIKEEKTDEPKEEIKEETVEPKIEEIKEESKEEPKKEDKEVKEETPESKDEEKTEEDKKEEPKVEETDEKPKDGALEETIIEDSLSKEEISEWEKILNGADDMFTNLKKPREELKTKEEKVEEVKETAEEPTQEIKENTVPVSSTIIDSDLETLNQLLKPYGTDFDKLKGLISNEIEYKDGTKKEFVLDVKELINTINAIDGNDLKRMKIVGPETTILKMMKQTKEGK